MEHGLAGLNEGGKVENAVEGFSLGFGCGEYQFQSWTVCQFSLDKFNARGQQVAPAMAQVVINNGLMAILSQKPGNSTTYIPRTASNQDFHEKPFLSKNFVIALESNM
jgi:hypothetical protein